MPNSEFNFIAHEQLITLLDNMFPIKNPKPTQHIQDIMFDAGRRDIIEWLKTHLKRQLEENHNKVL